MLQCIGLIVAVYAMVRLFQAPFQHPAVMEGLSGKQRLIPPLVIGATSFAGLLLLSYLTILLLGSSVDFGDP